MFDSRLYCGAVGFDHSSLAGDFYDTDLPPEWRFQYYSNQMPAVFLPQPVVAGLGLDDLQEMLDEAGESFLWVLGTKARCLSELESLISRLPDLARRVVLVVESDVDNSGGCDLQSGFDAAGLEGLPICLDSESPISDELQSLVAFSPEKRFSILWRPHLTADPHHDGDFLVVRARPASLVELRGIIEKTLEWMGGHRGAGVFIECDEAPAVSLQQVRILAELLDVN